MNERELNKIMNYDKNKNAAKKNFIILLVLLPFGLVLSGFVIKYGWNNILLTIDGVPSINLPQAPKSLQWLCGSTSWNTR
ncbi:TPA: hypothetical protein ACJSIF_001692 [Streptococcus agalactiae]